MKNMTDKQARLKVLRRAKELLSNGTDYKEHWFICNAVHEATNSLIWETGELQRGQRPMALVHAGQYILDWVQGSLDPYGTYVAWAIEHGVKMHKVRSPHITSMRARHRWMDWMIEEVKKNGKLPNL